MEWSLRLLTVPVVLISLAGSAAAQPGDVATLKAFMASPRYVDLLNRAFASLVPEVFRRCPTLVSTTSNTMVMAPVTFDAAGVPIAGSWRQSFPVSGCGNDTTLNIFFNVLKDGKINTVVGAPGDSHADLVLQKDAFAYVGIALRSTRGDCPRLSVKTTTFEGHDLRYPPALITGQTHPSPPWWEMWTMVGCGHTWDVPVDFIPDATGTQVYQPSHIVER